MRLCARACARFRSLDVFFFFNFSSQFWINASLSHVSLVLRIVLYWQTNKDERWTNEQFKRRKRKKNIVCVRVCTYIFIENNLRSFMVFCKSVCVCFSFFSACAFKYNAHLVCSPLSKQHHIDGRSQRPLALALIQIHTFFPVYLYGSWLSMSLYNLFYRIYIMHGEGIF